MVIIKALASSSSGNAYLVSDGNTPLLLDAGIPFAAIRQKLDFGVSRLAGCLISHEHQDHAKATRDLMRSGIDCYVSKGTAGALGLEGHRLHVVEALQQFRLGTWAIKPFQTIHNAAEPLGFLLANRSGEKLLYATDTAYIKHRFNGLTHIILEANFSIDLLKGNTESPELRQLIIQNHMSLETLIDMLKANNLSKVEEIHLIHLSDRNADAEAFRRRIHQVTGKVVYVSDKKGE